MASYTSAPGFSADACRIYRSAGSGLRVGVSAVTITTIATVLTPSTGKKFRLLGGYISMSANASVLFEDNVAGTTVFRTPLLLANTPFYFELGSGYLSSAANNVLKATSSAAGALTGTLLYFEE